MFFWRVFILLSFGVWMFLLWRGLRRADRRAADNQHRETNGNGWMQADILAAAERGNYPAVVLAERFSTLSPDTAGRLLASCGSGATLDLRGLTSLSEDSAAVLARHLGQVCLNGLTTLTPECAAVLARLWAPLVLNGLRTISEQTAAALAQHHGWLSLDGLTSLSPEVARCLARHRHISNLGEFHNSLSLGGLQDLGDESAAALADFPGNLKLNGLRTLSKTTARCLARHRTDAQWGVAEHYSLMLDGLEQLSDEAAIAIAEYREGLSLDGLTALSTTALRALANHPGHALSLGRLDAMPDDVAAMFGTRRKWLFMPNLRNVSPLGLELLRQNPDVILSASGPQYVAPDHPEAGQRIEL
jgi:hypothetical protein